MRYCAGIAAVAVLTFVCSGCDVRHSSSAFHLPPNGDVAKGKIAFVAQGCHNCHDVPGVELPAPSVQPAVFVTLGGETMRRPSDAYLVTSMIDPSYHIAPYPLEQVTSGGKSRMPAYGPQLNIQQMCDIVAFLQSRYAVRRWTPQYVYY